MTRAVLSIGANLGDAASALSSAAEALRPWLVSASPVYRTPPWGPIEQPDFLNAVLIVDDPSASAHEWLRRAQAIEAAAGRRRDVRWGPRSLDVDVIDVDATRSEDPELILPHPRAAERAFVLVPWIAVDPGGTLAGIGLATLIDALPSADVAEVRPEPTLVLG